ncbi:hypothetical protein F4778DRAFT_767110 [Xylariomycetidae sp. FL2044]|nr:hypothetical protein F4778DRAFT_767110 [Xylariomycetidae sp. FL2044]
MALTRTYVPSPLKQVTFQEPFRAKYARGETRTILDGCSDIREHTNRLLDLCKEHPQQRMIDTGLKEESLEHDSPRVKPGVDTWQTLDFIKDTQSSLILMEQVLRATDYRNTGSMWRAKFFPRPSRGNIIQNAQILVFFMAQALAFELLEFIHVFPFWAGNRWCLLIANVSITMWMILNHLSFKHFFWFSIVQGALQLLKSY